MDARQSRLIEDLSDVFTGEISIDPVERALYGSDGSLYQVAPIAVASPRHNDDVVALVRYAAEHHWPLVPRGSGSSVTGGALGPGIIVDFSRHMRAMEVLDDELVRVQSGVVLDELNRMLQPLGRYFPPDPASVATTTIGSMLAVDAAGSHAISVGSTRDHVRELELVTADGDCWTAGRNMSPGAVGPHDSPEAQRQSARLQQLQSTFLQHREIITQAGTTTLKRRGGGYHIHGVMNDQQQLDLPRLLVGSEGTLAIFTSAVLHTLPLPKHRGAMLILFDALEVAARAVTRLVGEDPAACDLLDRRLLNLAREASDEYARLIPGTAEAALILEWSGWSASEILIRLDRYQRLVREFVPSCTVQCEATTPAGADFLWAIPRQVVPMLHRLQGRDRPLPFVEDIAVPPEYLEEYIFRSQKIFQRHNVVSSLYAHAPTGQLHLRPFLPMPTQASAAQLEALANDLYEAAWHLGGTISGEHGLGLVRTEFVKRQAGSLYPVYQEIKAAFDPQQILNPGKILSDEQHLLTRDLRSVGPANPAIHDLQLSWSSNQFLETASTCNGCGRCRSHEPHIRMCPLFRIDAQEAASPRAKANLARQTLAGELPEHWLASPEFKRVADLCFNCRQCQFECPSGVDIPHIVQEIKSQYVAQNGLPRSLWFLTRSMDWGDWINWAAPVLNPLLATSGVRWLMERLFGIARLRKLPSIAAQSFIASVGDARTAPPRTLNRKTVIYFPDYFANHHDPELGWACVKVLEHQGLQVHIPPRQSRCGMELIAAGDAEWARAIAEHNVKLLVEFAREGCPILCSEPTAAVCLSQDYPLLLGTEDARVVAEQTREVGRYLQDLQSTGTLRQDFAPLPVSAGYHLPCHLRALGHATPLLDLCQLIPELSLSKLQSGCSGMAGTFGMEESHFAASQAIGRDLSKAMQNPAIRLGLTECSSCRVQMEQTVPKVTVHPLKMLAAAYGLMPEVKTRLLQLQRQQNQTPPTDTPPLSFDSSLVPGMLQEPIASASR